jgi:DNA-binding transcriptional LysR family regulator
LDIRQLRALLAVADAGSVTRAAELLNIVQPAVSRQLRLLEEDLGTPLFERSRQGMALTEAGQILVDYARRALHELERARAEIRPSKGAAEAVRGIVTLGLLPSTAEVVSSALLSAVRASHPDIQLRLSTAYTGYLQTWLEQGDIDASLLYGLQQSNAIDATPLLIEPLWLVGPPAAGLSAQQPVLLADCRDKTMILPGAAHGLRSLVDIACAEAGITLLLSAETDSMRIQRSLVLGGHGYTILPQIAVAEDVARGILSAAPLTAPELQRTIVLATPTTRRITAATRCVLALLQQVMRQAVHEGRWHATLML